MSQTAAKKAKLDNDKPNYELAEMLSELADYEKNVNRQVYKYNAYRKAARTIIDHPTKITNGKEAKKLEGVGEKIAKKIDEYLKCGIIKKLEKVRQNDDVTAITELTKITGIGPAAAQNLVKKGIRSIEELKANQSELNHHQKIGLMHYKDFEKRIPRDEVVKIKDYLFKEINGIDNKYDFAICGSFRRGAESSGDIDLLLTHPDFTSITANDSKDKEKRSSKKESSLQLLKVVVEKLEKEKFITDTLAFGNSKFMGVCRLDETKPFRRLDIRLIPKDQYYLGILYFTGSDMFNKNMRKIAIEKGYTLNEYSIRKVDEKTGIPGSPLQVSSEEDIFKYLGMEYKKPEERNM